MWQAIVFIEIARRRAPCPELVVELSTGLLGDVLVEGARWMSGLEDSLDVFVAQRCEADGMTESGVDILGGVALAQEQDAASATAPLPGRPRAQTSEELSGVVAHLLEGSAQLVEIDGGTTCGATMEALRVEFEALPPRGEMLELGGGFQGRRQHGASLSQEALGRLPLLQEGCRLVQGRRDFLYFLHRPCGRTGHR
jgi:hypothetical protein